MIENNKKNFRFYENIGVENLQELSLIGGFTACKDMDLSWPLIKDAENLLELGAGTGRCVDYLIQNDFKGNIVAIEQSKPFIEHLNNTYGNNATIVLGDFKEHEFGQTFDAVLWMWSGILDFSEDEQKIALTKIHSLLHPNGVLIIDTPKIGFQTFAEHEQDEQHLHLQSTYGDLKCYIPSKDNITKLTSDIGYSTVEATDYNTATDKERSIYFIRK